MDRSCSECGGRVGPRNKTGICKGCFHKIGFQYLRDRDPDYENKRREGNLRAYRENPELLARARENMARAGSLPQAVEARRACAKRLNLSKLGVAAQPAGGEVRKRQARALSERKLAWCPRELRAEYLHLLRSKRMKQDEARALIMDQHEAELRRLRARMGVTGPVVVPEPRFVMTGYDRPPEDNTFRRAEAHKAEKARVDALRQRRTLCPICGARSDVGCEHGEAA